MCDCNTRHLGDCGGPWCHCHNHEEPSFKERLTALINEYSLEGYSDTPDFILAEYMLDSLKAFELATQKRDRWWDNNKAIARATRGN